MNNVKSEGTLIKFNDDHSYEIAVQDMDLIVDSAIRYMIEGDKRQSYNKIYDAFLINLTGKAIIEPVYGNTVVIPVTKGFVVRRKYFMFCVGLKAYYVTEDFSRYSGDGEIALCLDFPVKIVPVDSGATEVTVFADSVIGYSESVYCRPVGNFYKVSGNGFVLMKG